MTSSVFFTQFASPERADESQVAEQVNLWASISPLALQLLDAFPQIFLVLNEHRQVVFANPALLDLLGLPDAETVKGRRPGEILNCIHADENPSGCGTTEFCRMCGAVQAILAGLNGQQAVRECRIIQRDGMALDLRVWSTPLIIGDHTWCAFSIQDISHEKRRQALERVFFHDLLNLAQVLLGFTALLNDEIPSDEKALYNDLIQRASERLIEEILAQRELGQAEQGELPVRPVPLDSQQVLHEIRDFYQHHEVAQGRTIQIAPEAKTVSFTSDATLLYRVLGNMVKNALEACVPGQVVTLSCQTCEGQVMFQVHNPVFMPREVQLQIFQRSFSTKGPGRGLGTYSMKLLGERYLGGTVQFTTSPDSGTCFEVVLPLSLD